MWDRGYPFVFWLTVLVYPEMYIYSQVKLYEDFSKTQAQRGVEECVSSKAAEPSKKGSAHVFQVIIQEYSQMCFFVLKCLKLVKIWFKLVNRAAILLPIGTV